MKNRKNVITSLFSQIAILIIGLIVPRLIITNYGSDTNGVINTISQVFTYLALLEAGIGQATKNALYPFISNDKYDCESICDVMFASRQYYRKVTCFYAVGVIGLSFILPLTLKSDLSYFTLALIVLFEGGSGVLSFYFVQSWSMLFIADGKNYVVANIDLITRILSYGIKIVFALMNVNIVLLQFGFFCISLFKVVIYKCYVNKHYGWIHFVKPKKPLKLKDRNAYVVNEIAWTIFSSTDLIILSMFCSTKLASVYSVYNMIFLALNNLLNSVFTGLVFNLGQKYHDNIDEYKREHDLFNSLFMGGITFLMCNALLLSIPFVSLYTKGVTDIDYIYKSLPLLFCLVQILSWSRYVSGNLTGIAGYAKPVSRISVIEASINLALSMLFVYFFNIIGVLLATVLALPLKAIYCNAISEKLILKRSPKKTILIFSANGLVFLLAVALYFVLDISAKSYGILVLYGLATGSVFLLLILLANCVVNHDIIPLIKQVLKIK